MTFPRPSLLRAFFLGALALAALFATGPLRAADAARPLRVGVAPTLPPLVFKQNGEMVGAEPDFARALGAELGRPVEFVTMDWEELIPALLKGRTDIIMSGMSTTKARAVRVAFTQPYLRIGQMALIRRDDYYVYALGFPAVLPGPAGVLAGTTGDYLVQQEFPKSTRKTFRDGKEAARALARKKIALFIADSPLIWWLASTYDDEGLKALPVLLSEETLAWGVRRSDPELLEAANKFIEKLKVDGQLTTILKRWVPGLQSPDGK